MLKSIEFICSQILLHYQFAKAYRPISTGKHATKIAHNFLTFPCPPSVAFSALVLLHSLISKCTFSCILSRLCETIQEHWSVYLLWLLQCFYNSLIPLSYPCESSVKLEIKPQVLGNENKVFLPQGQILLSAVFPVTSAPMPILCSPCPFI